MLDGGQMRKEISVTLARIEFAYDAKFDKTQQEFITQRVLGPAPKFTEEGGLDWGHREIIMLVEDAIQLGKFEVLAVIDNETTKRLSEVKHHQTTVVNERCHVAVPGLGLLLIDKVKVMENLCTDVLQRELDKGWKILAICVQPDQRRPDYILGKPEPSDNHE